MADIDYSNTILIVRPLGEAAVVALKSKPNESRLVTVHFEDGVSSISQLNDQGSRECTPYVQISPENQLHLKFDPKPKDSARGFVFGTNAKKCDIVLLENPNPGKNYGISQEHFSIDFNWTSGYLRLNNISQHGTGMGSPTVKNGFQLLRHNRMHMLHPEEQTKIYIGPIEFELSFPDRGQYQDQYEWNLEVFRAEVSGESRHTAYLLHDVIGTGEFGQVCKATDHHTAELFAAKIFGTEKHKLNAQAYVEVAIAQKITHEHIVEFVDYVDDGGGVVLIMEYMPMGNLQELNEKQKLSLEEIRTVLHQALQALTYLHDKKNITHRDIKPANILVRSRTPELFIKLCDFGLSTEKSNLKTRCGTELYAAAEVFSGLYTNAVDIWAMGVVGCQFTIGLPGHTKNMKPRDWSETIRSRVERACLQGNKPSVLLLKRMLELKPLDRPSARDCLSDLWIRNTTRPMQSRMELIAQPVRRRSLDPISEQQTEILGPLWRETAESGLPNQLTGLKDPRKRLRCSESLSGDQVTKRVQKPQFEHDHSTTVASSVDEILEFGGEQRHTRAYTMSQRRDGDRGDKLPKGPQNTIQTSNIRYDCDPHCEVGKKHLPRVQITTGQTGRKTVFHELLRNQRGHTLGKLSSNRPPACTNKPLSQVTDFDANHVQMKIDNKALLMRKNDGFLNVTQIISLTEKTPGERKYVMNCLKRKTKVEVLPPLKGIGHASSWVNFQHGWNLVTNLGMESKLRPLIDYYECYLQSNCSRPADQVDQYLIDKFSEFLIINVLPQPVFIRKSDLRINVTHIFRAVSQERARFTEFRRKHEGPFDIVRGKSEIEGTYVNFEVGIELCQKYRLTELETRLLELKATPKERAWEETESHTTSPFETMPHLPSIASPQPDIGPGEESRIMIQASQHPVTEPEEEVRTSEQASQDAKKQPWPSEFIEIREFLYPVMVSRADSRINASSLLRLAGRPRREMQSIKKTLCSRNFQYLHGAPEKQGTYVDFDIGITLCEKYRLSELKERLLSLRPTPEEPFLGLPQDHINNLLQILSPLPGNTVPQPTKTELDQTQMSREFFLEGPNQPDHTREIESYSDLSGSETSLNASEHSSSESTSGRKSPIKNSINVVDEASVRQGNKSDSTLSEGESPPVKTSRYSVWDSEPQHSRLSEVKLDFKPPSRPSSRYGSATTLTMGQGNQALNRRGRVIVEAGFTYARRTSRIFIQCNDIRAVTNLFETVLSTPPARNLHGGSKD